jgi:hypothetical protein
MTEKCDLCKKDLGPYERRVKVIYLRQEMHVEAGEEVLVAHVLCFLNYIKETAEDFVARIIERRSR